MNEGFEFKRKNIEPAPAANEAVQESPEKLLEKLEADLRSSFETAQQNGGSLESPEKSAEVGAWKTEYQDLLLANEGLCARVIERTAPAKDSQNTFECQLYRLAAEASDIRRRREPSSFKMAA